MKLPNLAIGMAMLCFATAAFAIEDTTENRTIQAERNLAATPPAELMKGISDSMAMNLAPEDRPAFRKLMTQYVDMDRIAMAIKDSLVKNFTADELSALADLYESPEGKSAMQKMGTYMSDIMPTIEAEVFRAFGEMQKENMLQNQELPDLEEESVE